MAGVVTRMLGRSSSIIDGTQGSTDAGILAAVYFTVTGTTVNSITGYEKNVASVTRLAQGIYRIAFTSALANTNYGLVAGGRFIDSSGDEVVQATANRNTTSSYNSYSTTQVDIVVSQAGSRTAFDPEHLAVIIFDPQAVSSAYLAAASWTVSGTTLTLQRQTNVASMNRIGVGGYSVNFNSALAAADYGVIGSSRYPDFTNSDRPFFGISRNTTGPANVYSTTRCDLSTGKYPTGQTTVFEPGRGSALFKDGASNPRGTLASVRFSVSGGVVTIDDQWNVASVARTSGGFFTVNFTSALVDANYAVIGNGRFTNFADYNVVSIGLNRNSSSGSNVHSTTQCSIGWCAY